MSRVGSSGREETTGAGGAAGIGITEAEGMYVCAGGGTIAEWSRLSGIGCGPDFDDCLAVGTKLGAKLGAALGENAAAPGRGGCATGTTTWAVSIAGNPRPSNSARPVDPTPCHRTSRAASALQVPARKFMRTGPNPGTSRKEKPQGARLPSLDSAMPVAELEQTLPLVAVLPALT